MRCSLPSRSAILAAIYASEFMQPKVRAVIKPTIEMMASLPSVVLGFIAALVLAPWVEASVIAVLLVFFAIPAAAVTFGFLWQFLPVYVTRRIPGWASFGILVLLVLAPSVSLRSRPTVEALLFQGDFKGWLAGRVGTATPGWAILLTPLCLIGLSFGFQSLGQASDGRLPARDEHHEARRGRWFPLAGPGGPCGWPGAAARVGVSVLPAGIFAAISSAVTCSATRSSLA